MQDWVARFTYMYVYDNNSQQRESIVDATGSIKKF